MSTDGRRSKLILSHFPWKPRFLTSAHLKRLKVRKKEIGRKIVKKVTCLQLSERTALLKGCLQWWGECANQSDIWAVISHGEREQREEGVGRQAQTLKRWGEKKSTQSSVTTNELTGGEEKDREKTTSVWQGRTLTSSFVFLKVDMSLYANTSRWY